MVISLSILFAAFGGLLFGAWNDSASGLQGEPVLRLDAGGPTTFVTSLAWSAGGAGLYATGEFKPAPLFYLSPDR